MSTIDVIVPSYRYARFLEQCVRSVLDQSEVDVRVLIIDDASPDETPDVAAKLVRADPRVVYTRHAENKGHIRTYNEGIAWISSDYYLLLSADDYLLPGALARAARVLDENTAVGLVFGSAIEAFDGGESRTVRPIEQLGLVGGPTVLEGAEFIRRSRASNFVPTPTAIVRTALQKTCGGYREDLPHAGDMEMWFRLAARGHVAIVPEAQAVYRRHGSNMSLGFTADHMLPDFKQRQAVLQVFFQENSTYLRDPDSLREESLHALATQVMTAASTSFNEGRLDLSRTLEQYALEVSPAVRQSRLRWNLRVKRALGPHASRLARSLVGGRSV